MIQRIQSLLLAIIAVSMAGVPFTTLYIKQDISTQEQAVLTCFNLTLTRAGQEVSSNGTWFLAVIAGLVAATAAYSIFSFKNRKLQLILGFVNTLLIGAFIGITFYITGMQMEQMLGAKTLGERQVGFYIPLLAILLNFSANRLIRQDEMLVKSMDRLR